MLKVVIYARVSTRRDAQKNSLENQVSYAMNLAAQNGWTVVGQYIDDGISGATRNKREGIQRLLYDAKKKKFDAVIAKSVSRLGRNAVENLQTAHEIESVGIRLILPEDNYDTCVLQVENAQLCSQNCLSTCQPFETTKESYPLPV